MLKDCDIREPLFEFLEETYGKVRIIEEKNIGRSRADVVMISEEAIYGVEIKSDADSYTRLAGQVKDYEKYFDYNYVVVGTSHALHIKEHVPAEWGIITVEEVDDEIDFYIYRLPEPNRKVKYERQLHILWRPELAFIQQEQNMPKYKEKSKDFVIDKILERTKLEPDHKHYIEMQTLKRQISDVLFNRDYNEVNAVLQEYRKGEMQKQVEAETDPEKKLQLMMELEEKRKNLPKGFARKKRRRRRRY